MCGNRHVNSVDLPITQRLSEDSGSDIHAGQVQELIHSSVPSATGPASLVHRDHPVGEITLRCLLAFLLKVWDHSLKRMEYHVLIPD